MSSSRQHFLKYFFRLLLALVGVLVLGVLLLQVPVVQQFLTVKLENYLQAKLKTEVTIQAIRLKLPQDLSLQGVYIEDTQQDTFLNVEALDINFKLNQLLNQKIQFDRIALRGGVANIFIGKDSANYDFILSAFQLNETALDTVQVEELTPSSDWLLTFDNAGLALENVAVHYFSETDGIDVQTQMGIASGQVREVDYLNHKYDLSRLYMANSSIKLKVQAVESEKDTTIYKSNYFVNSSELRLENIDFRWLQEDFELQTTIGKLVQQKGYFKMVDDSIGMITDYAKLENSSIQYDVFNTTDSTNGFDVNHFQFEEVGLELADFRYDNLNLKTQILQAKARDKTAFVLADLATELVFSPEEVQLKNLEIKTNQTKISSHQTIIKFPFFESTITPIEQLNIQTDLNIFAKEIADFQYFYPPLQQISFLQKNSKKPLHLVTNLNGSLQYLEVKQLDFNGLTSSLKTTRNDSKPFTDRTNTVRFSKASVANQWGIPFGNFTRFHFA